MRIGFFSKHWNDSKGRPAGGVSSGRGFTISWQNGPLGKIGTDERKEPNGALVEDVIDAARDRIEYYQQTGFACGENQEAINYLTLALESLDSRTTKRISKGVEGTHEN
jgi:hypothetical protein